MTELTINKDEYEALMSIGQTLDILGTMFETGEESPRGLRMAVASVRTAADVLELVAMRWEEES